jgi:hypothetical protein
VNKNKILETWLKWLRNGEWYNVTDDIERLLLEPERDLCWCGVPLAKPRQESTACGYDETVGMCTNNPCCEQTPVAHLWECIGRWSAYLVSNREKANLAPPEWLVDAVKAATVQPKPELTFDVDGEQLTVQQMANLELYKFQEATGYTFADEIFKLEPKFCKDCGKGLLGKEHIHTCSPQIKRQWVGLTAEDIFEITERHTKEGGVCEGWIVAVEVQQKLKDKNT